MFSCVFYFSYKISDCHLNDLSVVAKNYYFAFGGKQIWVQNPSSFNHLVILANTISLRLSLGMVQVK